MRDEVRSSIPQRRSTVLFDLPGMSLTHIEEDISHGIEWTIRPETAEIVIHLSGQMSSLETELDGRITSSLPASIGEIWSVPPGHQYASRARGGQVGFAVLNIDPVCLGEGASFEGHLQGQRDRGVFSTIRQICSEHGRSSGLDIEERGWTLARQLSRVLGARSASPALADRFTKPVCRRIREYVGDRLAEPISVEDLATLAGLSKSAFFEAFRATFGVSPARFVMAARLRVAQSMLVETREDIASIAYATGFSSHAHLSTSFRQHIGLSPAEFRAEWRR